MAWPHGHREFGLRVSLHVGHGPSLAGDPGRTRGGAKSGHDGRPLVSAPRRAGHGPVPLLRRSRWGREQAHIADVLPR